LSPKNGPLGQRPGPGKDGQSNAKHPYLWCSPQKSSNPKQNFFFSILTTRLVASVEGLNSSLALAARELWPKECQSRSSPFQDVKGFNTCKQWKRMKETV